MKVIYDGYVQIIEDSRINNGEIETFTKVKLRGASGGLVVNEQGLIALVKQYRPILGRFTLEIPAGTLDKNISKQEIIIEELEEECGISREDIIEISDEPIISYNIIENMSDGLMHIYFVRVKTNTTHPKDDDDVEDVNYYTIEEIEEMIKTRIITDPKTLIAFYLYKDMIK